MWDTSLDAVLMDVLSVEERKWWVRKSGGTHRVFINGRTPESAGAGSEEM